MQGFLTRAGTARNCRCKTCIDVAKTVVRRSTTGAEVKVNYRHAFTTLYTSIFATAAVVDAKWKDDRTRELDAQINEAKEAVARLQLENASAEAKLSPGILERAGFERRTTEDSTALRPTRTTAPIASNEASTGDLIFEQYGGRHWDVFHTKNSARTLRKLKWSDHEMLQEWLDLSTDQNESEGMTVAQPEDYEANVLQLVNHLLVEHEQISPQRDTAAEPSPLRSAIERLKSSGLPGLRWHNKDPSITITDRIEFAENVRRDIDSDMKATIERICYNLLTSRYPLTMHSYNTLIVQLSKAGYHRLAECVLMSHFAHFKRHHPLSAAVVLDHDKNFGNYAGIHRNISVILKNSSYYFARNGQLLLETMVSACAGIGNVSDAAVVLRHGLDRGLSIRPQALVKFLGLCIWKLDRSLAILLLRAFTDNQETFEAMLRSNPTTQSILVHQVNYLLDITNLWQQPAKLTKRLRQHDLDPEAFCRFRTMLVTSDIERELNQIARTFRRIQGILHAEKGQPILQRVGLEDRLSRAVRAARDGDFHIRAAMPISWVTKDLVVARSRSERLSRRARHVSQFDHAPQVEPRSWAPRQVWTREDYTTARANLRIATLSKEVTGAGDRLLETTSQLIRPRRDSESQRRIRDEDFVDATEKRTEAEALYG